MQSITIFTIIILFLQCIKIHTDPNGDVYFFIIITFKKNTR